MERSSSSTTGKSDHKERTGMLLINVNKNNEFIISTSTSRYFTNKV